MSANRKLTIEQTFIPKEMEEDVKGPLEDISETLMGVWRNEQTTNR